MSSIIDGSRVTAEVMLIGGMIVDISILMVPLFNVLPQSVTRWVNIVVGSVVLAGVRSTNLLNLDDIFFKVVRAIALVIIIGLAWRWHRRKQQ